jgi:hypothetical protein
MSTVDELNNIATDQKDNLIWEEVNDGEYLLEINSDFYVYEVVLNNTEHGKFNWRDYPVILHRYKFSDQTKPLDTRHCEDEFIAMATAAAWERISIRAHRRLEDEVVKL